MPTGIASSREDNIMTTEQWHWMMEWCKRNMLHPGESWVWAAAEKAYKEHS